MVDVTVIILTKNEELHLGRCLERLRALEPRRVVVVDSESTDATAEIARREGAEVVVHPWPGNQAAQFNWALDALDIRSAWVLRLDADEYLSPELTEEIRAKLPTMPADVSALVFKRRHIFMGRWMRRGTYPVLLLRMFRTGAGRYEQRLMDEHIVMAEGREVELDNDFYDHNLNELSWFCKKHVDYAVREAAELLDLKHNLSGRVAEAGTLSEQALAKRRKKLKYAQQPLFWRSTAYFVYRYFFKLGFMEGKEGFLWHFLQGWWYRTLVDAKVMEVERACAADPGRIRAFLAERYGIRL